jgi:hypothetical protein
MAEVQGCGPEWLGHVVDIVGGAIAGALVTVWGRYVLGLAGRIWTRYHTGIGGHFRAVNVRPHSAAAYSQNRLIVGSLLVALAALLVAACLRTWGAQRDVAVLVLFLSLVSGFAATHLLYTSWWGARRQDDPRSETLSHRDQGP